jgi:hypothetical protein
MPSRRLKLVDPAGRFMVPVVADTREQLPFGFQGMLCDAKDGGGPLTVPVVRGTLKSGDYSLKGFESRVAVERKSVADLFGTLGQGRDRFERELGRLAEMEYAAVVVEGDWREILGIYPGGLYDLRREFEAKIAALDSTQPWVRWLATLERAMPGPPEHSQLSSKTVFRSVAAWDVRYAKVSWWPCPERAMAEVTTFRLLEKWLQQHATEAEVVMAHALQGPGGV